MSNDLNELQIGGKKNDESGTDSTEIELDAKGLYCPEPVMLLHNQIRDMNAGQSLKLVATDPSTTRDVPKFCLYLGHELLSQTQHEGLYVYFIKKKQD
jgi:tRNA 2-thiouridine synthesizing protein A